MSDRESSEIDHSGAGMRQRAKRMVSTVSTDVSRMTSSQIKQLLYEFQVHQVELVLQNEQLREAQLELSLSRDRFADLYDYAPVGYLTLDSSGLVIEANFAAASILGVGRDRLLRSKFSDFLAPSSQDAAYLYWQKVFAISAKHVIELELLRPDGRAATIRLESTIFNRSLSSQSQSQSQCHIAFSDTTDLKNLRESLLVLNADLERRVDSQVEEIRLMASALANLNEGVMITSNRNAWPESQVVFANDAMCKHLGYTLEEICKEKPEDLLEKSIDASALAQIADQIAAFGVYRGVLDYTKKDGERGEIELSVSPLKSSNGESVHFVVVLRDTTSRKRYELALQERKERVQAIQDAVLDTIITIDNEGIIQDCNAALERTFGYTPAQVLGCNINLLMPESNGQKHDGFIHRFLETGEAHVIGKSRELRALHRDGHTFPIVLSVSAVDHLGLYTGVIRDISAMQQLQREILLAAGRVQWSVGQALHDGPQQALAGLSLMARGLATDLDRQGSPLAVAAKGLSERLKEENRLIRLLGRGLIPVQVGASGLVSALESLASQISMEKNLLCEFECLEAIDIEDHYMVDQLYHIAQEAALNAANHSGADRVTILLSRQGQSISLRVVDNGCGFKQAETGEHGLGLRIMPYRAATIGAVLTISDAAGGGTVVECKLDYCVASTQA